MVREVYKAPPTTEVQAVNVAQPPESHAADPYAQAFADEPVEPPDWASAVFGNEPEEDDLLPPQWLDGHDAAIDYGDPPTPPLGTPRIDPDAR